MAAPATAERILPWVMRALWIAVLVTGGRAIDSAIPGSDAATAVPWPAFAGWVVGGGCTAFPAVPPLTAALGVGTPAAPRRPHPGAPASRAGVDAAEGDDRGSCAAGTAI